MIKVVTHDGKFHPDEIFACVLLEWFKMEPLSFIRTRSESSLTRYKESNHHYVIDVGGDYNPNKLNFDHHQSSFTEVGENGDQLSSCGLMWKHIKDNEAFRRINYLSDFMIDKITEFTIAVDRHDNGVEFYRELEFISLYNFENSKNRFKRAYRAAEKYFFHKVTLWRHLEEMTKLEQAAVADASDGIIYSENKLSVNEFINSTDNKVLVCKRAENEYSVTSLNQTNEVDFSVRCPAPKEWAGKSGKEIKKYDKSLVFCHKNLFLTVVGGTKEDALRVAKLIVETNKSRRIEAGLQYINDLKKG